MIYAPLFVFCPEGDPALGGSPLRLILRRPYPSIPPFPPLRNILSINHLERAKTLLPRALRG